MADGVKGRSYDSPRRQGRTEAARAAVVAAGRRLFEEQGFPATTMDSISAAADVPIATVYRLFGSKGGVLAAVLDIAFVGDDEPVALHERPTAQRAAAEEDPRRMLAGYARLAREVLGRSGSIQHVLRSAASVDADAAELLARVNGQRLAGQARVARALAERGVLDDGITEGDATDIIYVLMAPETHRILTVERGWSDDRYEAWLADCLVSTLLVRGA
jgi:AcrR family transcriptional regulator